MPTRDRFEFALDNTKKTQWELFEELASSFLSSEYTQLRTMASASGDGGRDSELFSDEGISSVAFQYSVTDEWGPKIRSTVRRLEENFGDIAVLKYVTNQKIGAKADELKRELMGKGKVLDVLDQSWFLDRLDSDMNRAGAAERYCSLVADPIIDGKGLSGRSTKSLTRDELSVALFYLDMQRADDEMGKNLTRTSFEALVKAALADATPENPMPRDEIYTKVKKFLPRYEISHIKRFIDSALSRLKRRDLNYWEKTDSFNLNHTVREHQRDLAAQRLLSKDLFAREITETISGRVEGGPELASIATDWAFACIDSYFLKQGERFASAVIKGEIPAPEASDLSDAASEGMSIAGVNKSHAHLKKKVTDLVLDTLAAPSLSAKKYLTGRANSYTLLAFLSETPDIQSATNKLFSRGIIWLDSSALLPLFPEATSQGLDRTFHNIFERTKRTGTKLKVSPGVVEEVERHLNRCRSYASSQNWSGSVPYVYQRYVLQGGQRDRFSGWLEKFIGDYRPMDDVIDFLREVGIDVAEPELGDRLDDDLRSKITSYWQEIHARRRGGDEYNIDTDKLARHDIECVITVLNERAREGREAGFKSWLLTLDGAAHRMAAAAEIRAADPNFISPIMSLDFLLKYLAYGPARDIAYRNDSDSVRVFAPELFDNIPPDLMSVAEKVRSDLATLDMSVVKRRVRDGIDKASSSIGEAHLGGLEEIDANMDQLF